MRRDKLRKSETLRIEITNVYYVTAKYFRHHDSGDDPGMDHPDPKGTPLHRRSVNGLRFLGTSQPSSTALMTDILEYVATVQGYLGPKTAAPLADVYRVRADSS